MAVGTTAAILGSAAIGLAGSLATGFIGSNAAQQASKTEAEALDKAIRLQQDQYTQSRIDSYPWAMAGAQAMYRYMDELGIPRPQNPILPDLNVGPMAVRQQAANTNAPTTQQPTTQGFQFYGQPQTTASPTQQPAVTQGQPVIPSPQNMPMTAALGFRETPGYGFRVAEGEKAIRNNAAALGMRNSGATAKALTGYRMGLADQTYDNYLTRLSNLATGGQQQTNNTNALGANTASNVGNAMAQQGVARASGYVGSANAWNNSIGNMANTGGYALGWLSGNRGWAA